ncbi:peptidase S15, partial [Mesorhizobium sp. M7A.T.Ca.TU.009.01.1.2]
TGMVLSARHVDRFIIHPDNPNSAVGTCTWDKSYGRGDWQVRLSVKATVRALRKVWRIETHITAHDGDELIVDRNEVKEYPRDLN